MSATCTRYASEENQRIQLFVELAAGRSLARCGEALRLMGDLMYQSHWSYTECGLGNEATDLLVDLVREEREKRSLWRQGHGRRRRAVRLRCSGRRRRRGGSVSSRGPALRGVAADLNRTCLKAVPWAPTVSAWWCRSRHECSRNDRIGQERTSWYFLLLALASLIWSAQGTAVKVLDRHMGPIAITFLPFYITTLLFVPLLLRSGEQNPSTPRPSWRGLGQIYVAGVVGQVLAQSGMTWGITKSLASNGAILNLMIPVITAVLASFMLKES